jgi:hypothetical protein
VTVIVKPAAGTKVWRKDILGYAGVMYRQQGTTPRVGLSLHPLRDLHHRRGDLKAFWHDSAERSRSNRARMAAKNSVGIERTTSFPAKTEFKDKHPRSRQSRT